MGLRTLVGCTAQEGFAFLPLTPVAAAAAVLVESPSAQSFTSA
jgi:hypothetical protein